MAVPKIQKVVVNMGLGEATSNAKIIDTGADELARITGQKPVTRRAKKSIAQFKVRKGQPVGDDGHAARRADVGVPRSPDELALPRVRDFKGVSPKGFDGRGNYTLGLRDQMIFPEIDYMKVDKARGMNISVVTTAKTDEEARKLLEHRHAVPAELSEDQGERNMATTAKIAKENRRRRSSRSGCATVAACADGRAPTCGSSRCAACASASSRSKGTSPG